MRKSKIRRDQNVCFWCKYADHSYPTCRRNAPQPMPFTDGDDNTYRADWPYIDLAHDWCAEFKEGTSISVVTRKPQKRDLDDLNEMGWEAE